MHELSLLRGVVATVERAAAENNVAKIEKVVLQIGEFSSVVADYLRRVYPSAVAGTVLEGAALCVETVRAVGKCASCGAEYVFSETDGVCPACGAGGYLTDGGPAPVVKEIVVSG